MIRKIILYIVIPLVLTSMNLSAQVVYKYDKKVLYREDTLASSGPAQSLMNINNMAYWITKSGGGTGSGSSNGVQADYPIGTGGIIYRDGILFGALVKDDQHNSQGKPLDSIRVNGSMYEDGLKAGRVIYKDDIVFGATDPAKEQVWRVRRDYRTADLTNDATTFFNQEWGVSEDQIKSLYDQYDHDWHNWPAAWGAPFEDMDNDGFYDPDIDIPGYPGADQTIWLVANDVPEIVDDPDNPASIIDEISTSYNLLGSPPIGFEMRITLWGYDVASTLAMGNVIFKQVEITYTGLKNGSAGAIIPKAYFAQWSDPDIGTYTDDYVGCDTVKWLAYGYNSKAYDGIFSNVYQVPVPAVGYDILRGPVNADGDTLGMTAFTYFGGGGTHGPDYGFYAGTLQTWNMMEGYVLRPAYPSQVPWTDIITGLQTRFVLSGDPITGQGWIDGVQLAPGDRRFFMASGPFSMEPGDSQELTVALIGAQGADHLSSVEKLFKDDIIIQNSFDHDISIFGVNVNAAFNPGDKSTLNIQVTVSNKVTELSGILMDTGKNQIGDQFILYDDGHHNDQIAGDHIFGARIDAFPTEEPLSLTLIMGDGSSSFTVEDVYLITTDGPVKIHDILVEDDESGDGRISPGEKGRISIELLSQTQHEKQNLKIMLRAEGPLLSLSKKNQLAKKKNENFLGTFYSADDDATFSVLEVDPDASDQDPVIVHASISDELGNTWSDSSLVFIEEPVAAPYPNSVSMDHVRGTASGDFEYMVFQPWNLKEGHEYELTVNDADSVNANPTINLQDITSGSWLLKSSRIPDDENEDSPWFDYPVIDGFKIHVQAIFRFKPEGYSTYNHMGGYGGRVGAGDDVFSPARVLAWLDYDQHGKPFIIGSSALHGWTASSKSVDGSTEVTELVRDYEIRFTGVYGNPISIASGSYHPVTEGGSLALLYGARGYDIAGHPDPANPGTGDPFLIRVPFEVWDMEAEGGPTQVFMFIYDRIQNPATSTEMYAFDTDDRMYTEFSVQPYSEITNVDDVDESKLTWNLVWWNCDWTFGDRITFRYPNIISSYDIFRFNPGLNQPPHPKFEIDRMQTQIGLPVVVNAGQSFDSNNDSLAFSWTYEGTRENEPVTGQTDTVRFHEVGDIEITLCVDDGMYRTCTESTVRVKPAQYNTVISHTYLDSTWLARKTALKTVGNKLILCNPEESILKIYTMENDALIHAGDIEFSGKIELLHIDENYLFLKRKQVSWLSDPHEHLAVYRIGPDWELTLVHDGYTTPADYGDRSYDNVVSNVYRVDGTYYFKDAYSICRVVLDTPDGPAVLAQKNYNNIGKLYNVRFAGGKVFAVIDNTITYGGNYVEVLNGSNLEVTGNFSLPDSVLDIVVIDDLILGQPDGSGGSIPVFRYTGLDNIDHVSDIKISDLDHFPFENSAYRFWDISSIVHFEENLVIIKTIIGFYFVDISDPARPLVIGSYLHGSNDRYYSYQKTGLGHFLINLHPNTALIKYSMPGISKLVILDDEIATKAGVPLLSLHQNYPNPFNRTTTIHYHLYDDVPVEITIYDILGRKIVTLVDEHQSFGYKTAQWNARDQDGKEAGSGVYFVQIRSEGTVQSRKILLLK